MAINEYDLQKKLEELDKLYKPSVPSTPPIPELPKEITQEKTIGDKLLEFDTLWQKEQKKLKPKPSVMERLEFEPVGRIPFIRKKPEVQPPEIPPEDMERYTQAGKEIRMRQPELALPKEPIYTEKISPFQQALGKEPGAIAHQALWNLGNIGALGLPGVILKKTPEETLRKMGVNKGAALKQPETTGQQIGAGLGHLIGFIGSPLKTVSSAVGKIPFYAKRLKGIGGFFQGLSRSVLTLSVASGAVEHSGKTLPENIKNRLTQMAGGAQMGAVFGVAPYLSITGMPLLSKVMRMGVGSALIDMMQSESPWDERELAQKVYQYGLNAFFFRHGKADWEAKRLKREVAKFNEMAKKEGLKIDLEIPHEARFQIKAEELRRYTEELKLEKPKPEIPRGFEEMPLEEVQRRIEAKRAKRAPATIEKSREEMIREYEEAGKVEELPSPEKKPGREGLQFIEEEAEGLKEYYGGLPVGKETKKGIKRLGKEIEKSFRRMARGEFDLFIKPEELKARTKMSFPDLVQAEESGTLPPPTIQTPRGLAATMPLAGKEKPLNTKVRKTLGRLSEPNPALEHHVNYMNKLLKDGWVEIPKDFKDYPNFKNIGRMGGMIAQPHYWIPQIDGVPTESQMARMKGAGTPTYKYVLASTHDMIVQSIHYENIMGNRLGRILEGITKRQDSLITEVLKHIDYTDKTKTPQKLIKRASIRNITADVDVVRRALEMRKWYDDMIIGQNAVRKLRHQRQIRYRRRYTPDIIRKMSLWEKWRSARGKAEIEFYDSAEIPDLVYPDKPFNPRELQKEMKLPKYMKETRATRIGLDYLNTGLRDIYNSSIIKNNKDFAKVLEDLGYRGSAQTIQDWTAETAGGIKSIIDRSVGLGITTTKFMRSFRSMLHLAVFPLNFPWTTFIQTSSSLLTNMRYGPKNCIKGLNWFTDKNLRKFIADHSYSQIVKSVKSGQITRQEINEGVMRARKLNMSPLDKAADWTNFVLKEMERNLTGWSSATAKAHLDKIKYPRGRVYLERVSEGGGKTQSLYNLEDRPGFLRSQITRTAAPFQTFAFEVFNSMREIAGKTGIQPETFAKRAAMVGRLAGGMLAWNMIVNTAISRKPWKIESFIPLYNLWLGPILGATTGETFLTARQLPSPVQVGRDLILGTRDIIEKEDWRRMRRWLLRYGTAILRIPGGQQISNVAEGLIAIGKGGMYDPSGKMLFPIRGTKEQLRAMAVGPYRTKAGQEYLERRKGKKKKQQYFY